MSMFPITPLPSTRARRGVPPRVLFLLVVTVVTVGVMWAMSGGGDERTSTDERADRGRPAGSSTTSVPSATTTTAYRFAIDPSWSSKSSSRYSDSQEAKAERDELGGAAATTTTAPAPGASGASATTTTRKGATTTTTKVRATVTSVAPTAAPTTAAPPATTPPVTDPPVTAPPDTTVSSTP